MRAQRIIGQTLGKIIGDDPLRPLRATVWRDFGFGIHKHELGGKILPPYPPIRMKTANLTKILKNRFAIGEAEADHRVRDVGRTSRHQIQIRRAQRGEVEGPVVVPHGVVRLRAVVAVADVVNGYLIANNVRIRQHRDVWLPVGDVGWLQGEPPRQHRRETAEGQNDFPRPADENPYGQNTQRIKYGEGKAQPRAAEVFCRSSRNVRSPMNQSKPEVAVAERPVPESGAQLLEFDE